MELPLGGFTGDDGTFLIEHVPPGSYMLALTHEGYERRILAEVAVTTGRITEVRGDLVQEVVDLDELVVSGADITDSKEAGALEIRAAAATSQDAISSELMSRSGAGDVAGALKHVVGASVTEGKYAVVRGLSDRYTGTTLNGVRIPSADPRKRAVQVDLFPTGTIESVTVTKTFTPDLQGDFTGGGIDMKTRAIPEGRTLSITATSESNSLATGNASALTYEGGGVNGLARVDPDRLIPSIAQAQYSTFPRTFTQVSPSRPNPPPTETQIAGEYDRLSRSFEPVMGVSRAAPERNGGFAFLAGDRYTLGTGAVVGLMGGVTQTHKHDFYEGGLNNAAVVSDPQQGIAIRRRRNDSLGTDEALVGMLGSAVLQITPDQTVALQMLRNTSSEDTARFQVESQGYPSLEQNQSLHFTQRDVRSNQLHGTHILGGPREDGSGSGALLEWTLADNSTLQDEPDVRFFRNVFDVTSLTASMNFPGGSTSPQNTRRIFRTIEERNRQGGLDYSFPIGVWGGRSGRIKTGAFLERTDRDYEQHSFFYEFPTQVGNFLDPIAAANRGLATFQATGPDDLWTDVFLQPNRIGLAHNNPKVPNQLLWSLEPLGEDVDYSGDQAIDAAYVMADLPLSARWRVIGGARHEATRISIVPTTNQRDHKLDVVEVQPGSGDRAIVGVPQEEATADVDQGAWLPAVGFIFEAKPGQNVRLSWSRTLARPTFRELAPVATEEFIFGDEYIGNPDLTLSRITNLDARWELFPRSGDVLAASVFYKQIQDPIEVLSFAAGGRSFLQPVNFGSGTVLGVEMEARASVGSWLPRLHGLSASLNLTLIRSAVDVPEVEQESLASFGLDEKTRRLQGQPAYLVNFDVMYEHERLGLVGGLFYNRVGETQVSGAARGTDDGNPNVFQEAYGTLDVKVTKKFAKGLSASITGKNILRPTTRTVFRKPDG
ncbi:MAG TPA: TonB-dependent receptor, partial [Candidatus Binatia bacterium]|nr:TonB-dependent receptor [Candidatus Binatia bacterium]